MCAKRLLQLLLLLLLLWNELPCKGQKLGQGSLPYTCYTMRVFNDLDISAHMHAVAAMKRHPDFASQ